MLFNSSILQALDAEGNPINSYPAEVFSVKGEAIGTAENASQYVELWNSDLENKRAGRLFRHSKFTFKLLRTRHAQTLSRCFVSKEFGFVYGCAGSSGELPEALEPLEFVVDSETGPTSGTTELELPLAWAEKEIRIFIEGMLLYPSEFERTETGGVRLLGGRTWNNDGVVEGNPTAERIYIENVVSELFDYESVVGEGGPVAGTSTFNLPVDWQGKSIHVFVNRLLLNPSKYTRTTNGITLIGRTWNADGTGIADTVVICQTVTNMLDLEVVVGEPGGPDVGSPVLNLPTAWETKKEQIFLEGQLLYPSRYSRNLSEIVLIEDSWYSDGINKQTILIHNRP